MLRDHAPDTVLIPIDDLVPAEWNPRTITDTRFLQLVHAIEADPNFLWERPALARLADRKIYGGNMRWRAAKHLGFTHIPGRLDDITEEQAKARALRDNNNYGEWQEDELAALVAELNQAGTDLDTLGFSTQTLDDLLELSGLLGDRNTKVFGGRLLEADALLEKWQVQPGDLWTIPSQTCPTGAHRLICGDANDREISRRLMVGSGLTPFSTAVLLVADPPYGVDFANVKYNPRSAAWRGIDGDRRRGEALRDWLADVLQNWVEYMDHKGAYYVWAAQLQDGAFAADGIRQAGIHIQSQIVWAKGNIAMGQADYQWKHEICWYGFMLGAKHHWFGGRKQTTIWEISKLGQENYQHPNQKPTELFAIPMRNHTRLGEIVLDPFIGAGTTMVAGEQQGRLVYGCDIDPAYCAVTLERMADMGLQPERMEAGVHAEGQE